jgi:hypothetical protein
MVAQGVWEGIMLLTVSVAGLTYLKVKESRTSIQWLTFATESHPALSKLRDMSHRFGEEIQVIPANSSVAEIVRAIQSPKLQSNDIVIVSDATSVMQAKSQDTIRRRFLTFRRPIVFAGKEAPTDKTLAGRYGILSSLQPFPYLNPKLFIGRVGALRQLLANQPLADADEAEKVLTNAIQRQPWLAEIDTRGELFVTHVKKSPVSALEFDTHTHRVSCRGAGTQPCVIQSEESVIPFYAFFSV